MEHWYETTEGKQWLASQPHIRDQFVNRKTYAIGDMIRNTITYSTYMIVEAHSDTLRPKIALIHLETGNKANEIDIEVEDLDEISFLEYSILVDYPERYVDVIQPFQF